MVMHLKSCCCGFSVKTGSVLIGVLIGISGIIGLSSSISIAMAGTEQTQKLLINQQQEENRKTVEHLEQRKHFITVIFCCLAVVNAVNVVLAILLIFGAIEENPQMLKPWVKYTILNTTVQSFLGLVYIIFHFISGATITGIMGLVLMPFGIVVTVYFVLVVNSFHTDLISINIKYKIQNQDTESVY